MSNVLVVKSISSDIQGQAFCLQKFMRDLLETSLKPKFVDIDREDDVLKFTFSSLLTTQEDTDLTNLLWGHQCVSPILDALQDAEKFGRQLVDDYKELNILRGRTTAEVDTILNDLSSILDALFTGSLYVAIDRINAFTPTSLVTQADKDDFLNKLNKYLGL